MLLVLSGLTLAGWNDMDFSSPENYGDIHQGRSINLSLNVSNNGDTDGYAVYIINVTLLPPPCVNNGTPITIPGALLCTTADPSCRNRFSRAPTSKSFIFANVPTDPSCLNGLYNYSFVLEGNTELVSAGSRWSPETRRTETVAYHLRFVGPDVCGDGTCGGGETCSSCEEDCGICPECSAGQRTCLNSSVVECRNGSFTRIIERCSAGCEMTDSGPACLRVCAEGAARCANATTLERCVNNTWVAEMCRTRCEGNACSTNLCAGVSCPDKCEGDIAFSYGSCDPKYGTCTYFGITNCPAGCSGTRCAEVAEAQTPITPRGGSLGQCCPALFILLAGLGLARVV